MAQAEVSQSVLFGDDSDNEDAPQVKQEVQDSAPTPSAQDLFGDDDDEPMPARVPSQAAQAESANDLFGPDSPTANSAPPGDRSLFDSDSDDGIGGRQRTALFGADSDDEENAGPIDDLEEEERRPKKKKRKDRKRPRYTAEELEAKEAKRQKKLKMASKFFDLEAAESGSEEEGEYGDDGLDDFVVGDDEGEAEEARAYARQLRAREQNYKHAGGRRRTFADRLQQMENQFSAEQREGGNIFGDEGDDLFEDEYSIDPEDRSDLGSDMSGPASSAKSPYKKLLPELQDPKLFMIKCMDRGKEYDNIIAATSKAMGMLCQGESPSVSAFYAHPHLPGYVYVEAYKEGDVSGFTRSIRPLTHYNVKRVPMKEMDKVFESQVRQLHTEKVAAITVGSFVRIKRGHYRGDIAKVEQSATTGPLTVSVVPRREITRTNKEGVCLDEASLHAQRQAAANSRALALETAKKDKYHMTPLEQAQMASRQQRTADLARTPAKHVTSRDVLEADMKLVRDMNTPAKEGRSINFLNQNVVDDDGKTEFVKGGTYRFRANGKGSSVFFKDGYELIEIPVGSVEVCQPDIAELRTFSADGDWLSVMPSDDAKAEVLEKINAAPFAVNDMVKVISGDMQNMLGCVKGFVQKGAVMDKRPLVEVVPLGNDGQPSGSALTFPPSQLAKHFEVGEHVEALVGQHKGDTGMIHKIEDGQWALVLSDTEMVDFRINLNHLKRAGDRVAPLEKFHGFKIGDLVHLSDQSSVGLIVRIEITKSFRILRADGMFKNYNVQALGQKRHSKAMGLDKTRKQLHRDSFVKIERQGCWLGCTGKIAHIYGQNAWVKVTTKAQDGGYIVVKCSELSLMIHSEPEMRKRAEIDMNKTATNPQFLTWGWDLKSQRVRITAGKYRGLYGQIREADHFGVRVSLESKPTMVRLGGNEYVVIEKETNKVVEDVKIEDDDPDGMKEMDKWLQGVKEREKNAALRAIENHQRLPLSRASGRSVQSGQLALGNGDPSSETALALVKPSPLTNQLTPGEDCHALTPRPADWQKVAGQRDALGNPLMGRLTKDEAGNPIQVEESFLLEENDLNEKQLKQLRKREKYMEMKRLEEEEQERARKALEEDPTTLDDDTDRKDDPKTALTPVATGPAQPASASRQPLPKKRGKAPPKPLSAPSSPVARDEEIKNPIFGNRSLPANLIPKIKVRKSAVSAPASPAASEDEFTTCASPLDDDLFAARLPIGAWSPSEDMTQDTFKSPSQFSPTDGNARHARDETALNLARFDDLSMNSGSFSKMTLDSTGSMTEKSMSIQSMKGSNGRMPMSRQHSTGRRTGPVSRNSMNSLPTGASLTEVLASRNSAMSLASGNSALSAHSRNSVQSRNSAHSRASANSQLSGGKTPPWGEVDEEGHFIEPNEVARRRQRSPSCVSNATSDAAQSSVTHMSESVMSHSGQIDEEDLLPKFDVPSSGGFGEDTEYPSLKTTEYPASGTDLPTDFPGISASSPILTESHTDMEMSHTADDLDALDDVPTGTDFDMPTGTDPFAEDPGTVFPEDMHPSDIESSHMDDSSNMDLSSNLD